MTNINDFIDDKNHVNWAAYKAAQRSAGDICQRCGGFILFPTGSLTTCPSCIQLNTSSGSVDNETYIRCPKCKSTIHVYNSEMYDLYNEGEHEVSCDVCDATFVVSTRVTYTFESPELLSQEDSDDQE